MKFMPPVPKTIYEWMATLCFLGMLYRQFGPVVVNAAATGFMGH